MVGTNGDTLGCLLTASAKRQKERQWSIVELAMVEWRADLTLLRNYGYRAICQQAHPAQSQNQWTAAGRTRGEGNYDDTAAYLLVGLAQRLLGWQ